MPAQAGQGFRYTTTILKTGQLVENNFPFSSDMKTGVVRSFKTAIDKDDERKSDRLLWLLLKDGRVSWYSFTDPAERFKQAHIKYAD